MAKITYRHTKNHITIERSIPQGRGRPNLIERVRIPKVEAELFRRQTASLNRGLTNIRKQTKGMERETTLKYPNSVYNVPSNKSARLSQFRSLEEFRQTMTKNERLRLEVLKKPQELNTKGATQRTKMLLDREMKKFLRDGSLRFIDKRNAQYKENIYKSMNQAFGENSPYAKNMQANINLMTEKEFVKFFTSLPYELVQYFYEALFDRPTMNNPDPIQNRYNDITNYIIQVIGKKRFIPLEG